MFKFALATKIRRFLLPLFVLILAHGMLLSGQARAEKSEATRKIFSRILAEERAESEATGKTIAQIRAEAELQQGEISILEMLQYFLGKSERLKYTIWFGGQDYCGEPQVLKEGTTFYQKIVDHNDGTKRWGYVPPGESEYYIRKRVATCMKNEA